MKGDGRYGPAATVGSPCVFVDALIGRRERLRTDEQIEH